METEVKQLKQYAYLLEELCYYAVCEKVGTADLLNILPESKSITEKTNSLQSLLRFINNELAKNQHKERLQLLRSDYQREKTELPFAL